MIYFKLTKPNAFSFLLQNLLVVLTLKIKYPAKNQIHKQKGVQKEKNPNTVQAPFVAEIPNTKQKM